MAKSEKAKVEMVTVPLATLTAAVVCLEEIQEQRSRGRGNPTPGEAGAMLALAELQELTDRVPEEKPHPTRDALQNRITGEAPAETDGPDGSADADQPDSDGDDPAAVEQ